MMFLSDDKQADIIDVFNYIQIFGWYFNINNFNFDNMVNQIYPAKLQPYTANTSYTEASFLDMHLSIFKLLFLPKFKI